jgi:hypothetical protein
MSCGFAQECFPESVLVPRNLGLLYFISGIMVPAEMIEDYRVLWLMSLLQIPEGANSEIFQGPTVGDSVERKSSYSKTRHKICWSLVS